MIRGRWGSVQVLRLVLAILVELDESALQVCESPPESRRSPLAVSVAAAPEKLSPTSISRLVKRCRTFVLRAG